MAEVDHKDPEIWNAYYDSMEDKPLHPTFAYLEPYLKPGLRALDLGCGIGHGTIHMLTKGLSVTSVDLYQEALDRLTRRLPEGLQPNLIRSDFMSLPMTEGAYDVLTACFCLFFLNAEEFQVFWPRLVVALKPGGLLLCQLLGPNDTWADGQHSFHDADEVRKLLEPFEILEWEEVDQDGETSAGTQKHWHVYHLLARKR